MLATAAVLLGSPAQAESVSGTPRVIDGDTLEVAGTRIRLYGVDAPESKQSCQRKNGQEYRCGVLRPLCPSWRGRDGVQPSIAANICMCMVRGLQC